MKLLAPPNPAEGFMSSGRSIVGSSDISDGPTEPVQRVMDVLQTMMSDSSDSTVRQKANEWLMEFQRTRETHRLVLQILYAALLPERAHCNTATTVVSEDALPPPSPAAMETLGRAEPGAQAQFLFFVGQTLTNKLRKAISRPPQASDLNEHRNSLLAAEIQADIYCPPMDLLIMARRAADLDAGLHRALSQSLALAVGQMCILEIEKSGGEPGKVAEVLTQCHEALLQDTAKWKTAASLFEGNEFELAQPRNETVMKAACQSLQTISNGIRDKSRNETFAIEIFRAMATGAKSIAKARGLSDQMSQRIRLFLAQTAAVTIDLQKRGIMEFMQQLASPLLLCQALVTEGAEGNPIIQSICLETVELLRLSLQHLADFGELTTTILDAFSDISLAHPLTTDATPIAQLSEPLVGFSIDMLRTLSSLVESCRLNVVLSPLSDNVASDLSDALRQATVAANDQVDAFFKRGRKLADTLKRKRASQRGRRASDFGIVAKEEEDITGQTVDHDRSTQISFSLRFGCQRI